MKKRIRASQLFMVLIGAVGVGLATETFTIPLIVAAAFAVQYPFVIRSEEQRLLAEHKEKFKDYCRRVPRFIPSFRNFQEPEDYMMKPGIFRKRFIDFLWSVWLLGLLELVEALHEYGVFPALIKLF